MKSLIQKIIAAPGPSGYEKQIRQVIQAEVEAFADEIQVDALGNLILRRGSADKRLPPDGERFRLPLQLRQRIYR